MSLRRDTGDPVECPFELEVVDAISAGRWPDRVDERLSSHVASCQDCRDLARVVGVLAIERDAAWEESVMLPTADVVWLRAQSRARAEAVRQASHPIAVLQALGFACAAAVISVMIGAVAWWVWTRADWLTTLPASAPLAFDTMGFAVRGTLLAIALWLVLAPVAVYIAATDE
jgi:predicted anti-sigma-YlaC factor YlaD